MLERISVIKQKLDAAITQLCKVSWMFTKHPEKDFTRDRKLPFRKVVSFLLSMEGGTLTTELLKYFGCSADVVSASAFVQQRNKINADALPSLFDLFVQKTDVPRYYKGLRLLAADGSEIQIPTNPSDLDSYYTGSNGQAPYNLLHLSAMYDLLRHTYTDAHLLGKKKANERSVLCSMVDRSKLQNVLLIADRGFENYNLMAHIQEKGWFFLIRIQDIVHSRGIAAGLDLPDSEEFDLFVDLSLTTRQTSETKNLAKDRNQFRVLANGRDFDYLPKSNRKYDPTVFYKLPFRIIRFKITENSYETVVTNLDATNFSPEELKKLYNMRWGIETSFRELKYTVGLLHFHAKKVEHIYQEVFARLIMYNFTELVTSPVIIQKSGCKYAYRANFSVAVHVCRQFFLGNVSPPDVEALIQRHVSPVRPGRNGPRRVTINHPVSFIYRVA
jgi:arsenate reductase-like glutaredoxin family protein